MIGILVHVEEVDGFGDSDWIWDSVASVQLRLGRQTLVLNEFFKRKILRSISASIVVDRFF